MKRIIIWAMALMLPSVALAQSQGNPYYTLPGTTTTTSTNSTIAAANTFQSAIAASITRKGCLLVNKSTGPLLVYVGAPGSATTAQSIILAAGTSTTDGGSFNCGLFQGAVLTDQISVRSATMGAAFAVLTQ